MFTTLPIAFLLGLASTLHCWGMCGGILAAFTLGMPASRAGAPPRAMLVSGFNLGRVASYTLGGALAGGLGGALVALPWRAPLFLALQIVAGIILVLAGLRVGGWLHGTGRLEALGARAWSRIQPLCRRLLPVDRLSRALALGLLWGWLPCGLVYSALAWSAASASGVDGALTMAAFGAGTLPGMLGAGMAGAGLRGRLSGTNWRRSLAVLLVLLGLLGPLVSWHFSAEASASHGVHAH